MKLQNLIFAAALFALAAADGARAADNLYYAGLNNNGTAWNFGTINSSGGTTPIATGLSFGNAAGEKLMFAPDGTLYGFDVGSDGGPAGAWGRINPSTGAFAQIGNFSWNSNSLATPGSGGFTEINGCSLAFGPTGTLYATGFNMADGRMDFGTLDLATGAFNRVSASPVSWTGSIAAPVPEPSTIVLLGIGAIGLLAYAWRWRVT